MRGGKVKVSQERMYELVRRPVITEKTITKPRRPGLVGRNFFSAMRLDPRRHVD